MLSLKEKGEKMEQRKTRDSNFELLRIISIFIVIISHYNVHGFNNIDIKNISFNLYLIKIFPVGCVANHIFILLTGYFTIKSHINYKKIIGLIIEMTFYSLILYLFTIITNINSFNIINFIKSLFPIFFGQWFIIYYILLCIITPFVNKFVSSISKTEYKKLIIVLILMLILIPSFTNNKWEFTKHDYFLLDYFLGGYIRLYGLNRFEKKSKKYLFLFCAMWILSVIVFIKIGELTNFTKLINNASYLIRKNYSFVVFGLAFSLFLLFKAIKIKENKFINYISSSVLGIYLIHDNPFIRNWLWNEFWPNSNYFFSNFLVIHAIVKILIIFIICLIIDKTRILFFKRIEYKFSEKIYTLILKIKKSISNRFIILN